jgi:hypothetical protein
MLAVPVAAASPSITNTPTPTATRTPHPNLPKYDQEGNPYDGYWWYGYEAWVPGYISLETWYTPAPRHSAGGAVFYAPGVMEATGYQRGFTFEGFLDGVSLMSPADIGQTVWLKRPGLGWEGPFLVVDCARRSDMWPVVVSRDEVVEVGWQTATRWGMGYGHGKPWRLDGIEVWVGQDSPTALDLSSFPAQDYSDWFLDRVRFSTRAEDLVEGRIYTVKDHPGCWQWWTGTNLCFGDFYDVSWVRPEDYQPVVVHPKTQSWGH